MEHAFLTQIQAHADAQAFPGACGDRLTLRVDGEGGPYPVAVVEGVSEDRDWAPFHSHPTLERLIEIASRHGVKPVADSQWQGCHGARAVHTLATPAAPAQQAAASTVVQV